MMIPPCDDPGFDDGAAVGDFLAGEPVALLNDGAVLHRRSLDQVLPVEWRAQLDNLATNAAETHNKIIKIQEYWLRLKMVISFLIFEIFWESLFTFLLQKLHFDTCKTGS